MNITYTNNVKLVKSIVNAGVSFSDVLVDVVVLVDDVTVSTTVIITVSDA